MQRARAFVFAAEEDFGIAPVEAQACGTPVIAYRPRRLARDRARRRRGTDRPVLHGAVGRGDCRRRAPLRGRATVFDPAACRAHAADLLGGQVPHPLRALRRRALARIRRPAPRRVISPPDHSSLSTTPAIRTWLDVSAAIRFCSARMRVRPRRPITSAAPLRAASTRASAPCTAAGVSTMTWSNLRQQLLHQQAERRTLHQLERVGRQGAHRQHVQAGQARHLVDDAGLGAPGKDAAQPGLAVDAEQQVLARRAHVGVDQQRASAELAEADRQVGGEVGLAVADVGAQHGRARARAAFGAARPSSAGCAARERPRPRRRTGRSRRPARGAATSVAWRIRVVELLRQRPQHVVAGGELERDRRLAEAQPVGALVGEDLADLRVAERRASARMKSPIARSTQAVVRHVAESGSRRHRSATEPQRRRQITPPSGRGGAAAASSARAARVSFARERPSSARERAGSTPSSGCFSSSGHVVEAAQALVAQLAHDREAHAPAAVPSTTPAARFSRVRGHDDRRRAWSRLQHRDVGLGVLAFGAGLADAGRAPCRRPSARSRHRAAAPRPRRARP